MNALSKEKIAELRELHAKATPGLEELEAVPEPEKEWRVTWTHIIWENTKRVPAYGGNGLIFATEQEADDCIAGKMGCGPQRSREPEDVEKQWRWKAGPWQEVKS